MMKNDVNRNGPFKAQLDKALSAARRGDYHEAKKIMLKIFKVQPDNVEVLQNYVAVCMFSGDVKGVEPYARRLVGLEPNIQNYRALILALTSTGKDKELLDCYEKAIACEPHDIVLLADFAYALMQTGSWLRLEEVNKTLDVYTQSQIETNTQVSEAPQMSLAKTMDLQRNYDVAKSRARDVLLMSTKPTYVQNPDRKIRVGYLSNGFDKHAVGALTKSLYGLHDKTCFEIHCYSHGKDKSPVGCDSFVDIMKMSYVEAARKIALDGIDILVDLKGFTGTHRTHISALRAAPIQVRFLGFAGTSASTFFDYIITDKIVTPPENQKYYSEKFVYMPDTYQINDGSQKRCVNDVDPIPILRAKQGLPEKGIVFCGFHQGYKYEASMFDVWMQILKNVPGSVLWLKGTGVIEGNLKAEAEKAGVEPSRLIFAKWLEREDHLQRLQLADIALDTRMVNGAITTSDALWAGVPVITLKGLHFASRMSSSILTAFNMRSLITHDIEDYLNLAVSFAKDPELLKAIKGNVTARRDTTALFNTSKFVKNLEKGYKEMYRTFIRGERPKQIEVCVEGLAETLGLIYGKGEYEKS